MSKEEALTIPKMLADAGVKKLTFVGGEPTLCPYLGELLEEAKRVGLTTCIVSNGTGLTDSFLDTWGQHVDWVGLSIDASNDDLPHEDWSWRKEGSCSVKEPAFGGFNRSLESLRGSRYQDEVEHRGMQAKQGR